MLPQQKTDQIRKDAEDRYYYEDRTPHRLIDDLSESCYIAGATAEAEKAQVLVGIIEDNLHSIDSLPHMTEVEYTLLTRLKLIRAALQSYTNSLK